MADMRALLAGLEEFSQAFERHSLQVQEDYQQLHQSFLRLSFAFQGDAADAFYEKWARTNEIFREFIEASGGMRQLLAEKIADLGEVNRPEGS